MTKKELRDYLGNLMVMSEQALASSNKQNREWNLELGLHPDRGEMTPEKFDVEIKLSVLREIVAFLTVQQRSASQAETDKKNGGVRRGKYAPKKKAS